jgi:hypothetical protein
LGERQDHETAITKMAWVCDKKNLSQKKRVGRILEESKPEKESGEVTSAWAGAREKRGRVRESGLEGPKSLETEVRSRNGAKR